MRVKLINKKTSKEIVIEKLPDKKLPQIFLVEGNEIELLATFQTEEKSEKFISAIEELLNE